MMRLAIMFVLLLIVSKSVACDRVAGTVGWDEFLLIKNFGAATHVARGKVVGVSTLKMEVGGTIILSRIDIYESYKGKLPLEIIVKERNFPIGCAGKVILNNQYLLFLAKSENKTYQHISSPIETKLLSGIKGLLNKLHSGEIMPSKVYGYQYLKVLQPPAKSHGK